MVPGWNRFPSSSTFDRKTSAPPSGMGGFPHPGVLYAGFILGAGKGSVRTDTVFVGVHSGHAPMIRARPIRVRMFAGMKESSTTRRVGPCSIAQPSMIDSNPAMDDRFKTGQRQ